MCFKPLQPLTFSFNSFKQLEENCSSRLDHLLFTVKMSAEETNKYSIFFIHLLTTLIENICFYCKHSTDHKIKQQTPEICIVKKKLRYIEWVFTMEMGIKINKSYTSPEVMYFHIVHTTLDKIFYNLFKIYQFPNL